MIETIWQLSQNHLNILSTCARKFQYTYLEQLISPYLSQQGELNLGNRFHHLMQQRELGLEIADLLAADPPLQKSFNTLAEAAPNLVDPQPNTWRQAEHRRTFLKGNFLLTGIYDLLILSEKEALIIDWKTYPQPPDLKQLENNWQTRLYLYLLGKTAPYLPEQIKFTYWFINVPQKPTSVTFAYTQEKQKATAEELTKLLTMLDRHHQRYQENKESFPQVEVSKGYCQDCPFQIPCGRDSKTNEVLFSEIEEVKI